MKCDETALQELYETIDIINKKHFSNDDNHLVVVKNDYHKSWCVKFAGKDTDSDSLADGNKSMMFSAEYKDVKRLCGDVKKTTISAGYFDYLVAFGREHEKTTNTHNEESSNAGEAVLDWRPQSRDTPILQSALDARLALLSPEDAKTVKNGAVRNPVPGFLFHYMGGSDKLGSSGSSAVGDEIMTMYLCACISNNEAQAMRIFKSSASFRAWRPNETYDIMMKDAWKDVTALRQNHAVCISDDFSAK